MKYRFWQFVHNCVAHPLEGFTVLIFGKTPQWIDDFHNWAVPKEWGKH